MRGRAMPGRSRAEPGHGLRWKQRDALPSSASRLRTSFSIYQSAKLLYPAGSRASSTRVGLVDEFMQHADVVALLLFIDIVDRCRRRVWQSRHVGADSAS